MSSVLFSITLLITSFLFTLYGYITLDLYDMIGRPGPAFFPIIIGSLLVFLCGVNTYSEIRKSVKTENRKLYAKDAIYIAALILLYLATLNIIGAILSTYLFTAVYIFVFNKKSKMLFNLLFILLLPAFVYILFGIILNTELPRGLIFGG